MLGTGFYFRPSFY